MSRPAPDVVCDRCGVQAAVEKVHVDTVGLVTRLPEGWETLTRRYSTVMLDFCPPCSIAFDGWLAGSAHTEKGNNDAA